MCIWDEKTNRPDEAKKSRGQLGGDVAKAPIRGREGKGSGNTYSFGGESMSTYSIAPTEEFPKKQVCPQKHLGAGT